MRSTRLPVLCLVGLTLWAGGGLRADAQFLRARVRAQLFQTNLFKTNRAFEVSRVQNPQFMPIGQLESISPVAEGGQTGTSVSMAFLVSPCLIMTNSHVVLGDQLQPQPGRDYRMIFKAGISRDGHGFAGKAIATLILSGARDLQGQNDWALMKLSACIGKRPEFGWFATAERVPNQLIGKPVEIAYYSMSAGEEGRLLVSTGRVTGLSSYNGEMLFSASTTPGSSGSPILAYEGGSLAVVGLNTGSAEADFNNKFEYPAYNIHTANEFMNIRDAVVFPPVEKLIADDKADFGRENPAAATMKRSLNTRPTSSATS